jgi:NADPH:quinone reductase-like Zn-dependent oxidoreductase
MATTYEAVATVAPGTLRVVQRPMPEPGTGQVRMRVEAYGICHTDVRSRRAGTLPQGRTEREGLRTRRRTLRALLPAYSA